MGGAQAFAVPVQKRARAGTPDGEASSLIPGALERNSTLSVFGNKGDEEEVDPRRDEGQLSFGEKLRAGKDVDEQASDEGAKPELTEQAGRFSESGLELFITNIISRSVHRRRG
jgi:Ran-binding protein 3